MKRTVKALAVIALLFICNLATAQVNDAGLWASLSIEKKVTQRLSIGLTEELRFNENISELATMFTDLGVGYKFFKDEVLGISANYRYIRKKSVEDYYSSRHRWYGDLTLKKKFGMITPSIRTRFQSQFRDEGTTEASWNAEYYMRNRLMLKFDLEKKYRPYLGAELYTQLDGGDMLNDNVRISAGVDYSFNEQSAVNLGYLLDREFNVNNPVRNYVITVGYGFSF
jgi:hypothetical protein